MHYRNHGPARQPQRIRKKQQRLELNRKRFCSHCMKRRPATDFDSHRSICFICESLLNRGKNGGGS